MSSQININGHSFEIPNGASVSIRNGNVTVNGSTIQGNIVGDIHVVINGDVKSIDCAGSVEVTGNVTGDIDCGGPCTVDGNVTGNIDCGGPCHCENVSGDIDAGGSVYCSSRNK